MNLVLPTGWHATSEDESERLEREYALELPQEYLLAGVPVRVLAHCDGCDDVLLEHRNADLVSVVHLTWRGATELPNHPTLEFSGSFAEFIDWEEDWVSRIQG